MQKTLHVVPSNGHWAVREGKKRNVKEFSTQREAIEFARQIAKEQSSELMIFGRDGKIRERNSYGHDPSLLSASMTASKETSRTRKAHSTESQSDQEIIQSMLDAYHARAAEVGPLEAMLGMFDDDITDLSSITKEDVWEAYRKKFSDTP